MPVAGGILGGTTSYIRPEAEAILYFPHTRRTALGVRLNAGLLRPYGGTRELPYYLRYVMGGEYQIRGVELRSVGPLDEDQRVIGGDKFVLFNAEYYLDVFGPVRALVFHDAGQAFADTERIDLRQLRTSSGRRAARHRADAERAVPADLRLERLSRHVPAGAGAEVRRRHDVLVAETGHAPDRYARPPSGTGGVCAGCAVRTVRIR